MDLVITLCWSEFLLCLDVGWHTLVGAVFLLDALVHLALQSVLLADDQTFVSDNVNDGAALGLHSLRMFVTLLVSGGRESGVGAFPLDRKFGFLGLFLIVSNDQGLVVTATFLF